MSTTTPSKTNSAGADLGASAWQSYVATALPAGGISGVAVQPVTTQKNASTSRGYVTSGQNGPPSVSPQTTSALIMQSEASADDLPYVRGSIIDIHA